MHILKIYIYSGFYPVDVYADHPVTMQAMAGLLPLRLVKSGGI